MKRVGLAALSVALVVSAAEAQTRPPIDIDEAKAVFALEKAISDREGGRLWGMKLYGATFFVDPQTLEARQLLAAKGLTSARSVRQRELSLMLSDA